VSGVAIVRNLLANYAPLLALVPSDKTPGDKVFAGPAPQGTAPPFVTVTRIWGNEIQTIARRQAGVTNRERVQVTVLTKDPGGHKLGDQILKACGLGRGVHTGPVLGYDVKAILPEGQGPDLPVGDDKIHEKSRDFMVTFSEPN